MAKPGIMLRRPVGSNGVFKEHADLPDVSAWAKSKKRPEASPPKPSTSPEPGKPKAAKPQPKTPTAAEQAAERKTAQLYAAAQKKREQDAARAEAAERKVRERRERAIKKAEVGIQEARAAHDERVLAIAAERDALEQKARDEDARWERHEAAPRGRPPGRPDLTANLPAGRSPNTSPRNPATQPKTGAEPPFRRASNRPLPLRPKRAWRVSRARDNINCMFEDAAPVDVALAPSVEEFAERYVRLERPVIVRGAVKDWPPSYKWTPEYLKTMYGTRGVKIGVSTNGDYLDYAERLKIGVEPKVEFAKAVDSIFAPANADEKCRVHQQSLKKWGAPKRKVTANPLRSPKGRRQEHLDGVDRKRDEDTLRHGG